MSVMKVGSVDLIICQKGSEQIPYCQLGRDEQMRLSEGLINSEMDLDQKMQLTEEEDMRNILMIGGIEYSYHFPKRRKKSMLQSAATTKEQSVETIRKEEGLEKILEAFPSR
jgi:uncharacterized protein (DUF1697 family)